MVDSAAGPPRLSGDGGGVLEDRLGEERPERFGTVVAHVFDQHQAGAGDQLSRPFAAVGGEVPGMPERRKQRFMAIRRPPKIKTGHANERAGLYYGL